MSKELKEADLLEALKRAAALPEDGRDDPGLTSEEIIRLTGIGVHSVRAMLRRLDSEGVLVVGRRFKRNLAGTWGTVPVYSVKS